MGIDEMTLGELKEINKLFDGREVKKVVMDQAFLNKKCIIRTYSAGVHFGELIEKSGSEVILKNSRRLWYWKNLCNKISLSEVANNGLHDDSKVCETVHGIWLNAIEIIPCTEKSIQNIEGQNVFQA